MNLTDEQIEKILTTYKNKRERENKYYHEVKKNSEDYVLKNRQRAKEHYAKNKDIKTQKYQDNKEILKSKSLYNYYKKKDKIDVFEEKHQVKYELLQSKGFI